MGNEALGSPQMHEAPTLVSLILGRGRSALLRRPNSVSSSDSLILAPVSGEQIVALTQPGPPGVATVHHAADDQHALH
jgi:hypothetical protein